MHFKGVTFTSKNISNSLKRNFMLFSNNYLLIPLLLENFGAEKQIKRPHFNEIRCNFWTISITWSITIGHKF